MNINKVESVRYDKGPLIVNGFPIGVISPCTKLRLCLLDESQPVS